MSSHPAILFQAPNRVGLGHMNRLAAIAMELKKLDPQPRVVFGVEGSSHGFLDTYGLPHIDIPFWEELTQTKKWEEWELKDRWNCAALMARAMLLKLQVRLVVFDCFPCRYVLSAAVNLNIPAVMCLRKFKDDNYPFAEYIRYTNIKAILIPHDPGTISLPDPIAELAVFVGGIARPLEETAPTIPEEFWAEKKKWIVITGGGGGFPHTDKFYNLALQAVSQLHARRPDVGTILLTGPLFKDWLSLEIGPGVKAVPFIPDASSLFSRVDLVISQAGYNTMTELAVLGTPAICIPAPRACDDQRERAEQIAREHPHMRLFEETDVQKLAALMEHSLTMPKMARAGTHPSGARRAAEVLHAILFKPQKDHEEGETLGAPSYGRMITSLQVSTDV